MKGSRSMEECRKVKTWGSRQWALPGGAPLANGGLSILTMRCQRLSQGFEVSLTHRLCFSLEVFLAKLPQTLQSALTQNKEAYNEIVVWWETKASLQAVQSCILCVLPTPLQSAQEGWLPWMRRYIWHLQPAFASRRGQRSAYNIENQLAFSTAPGYSLPFHNAPSCLELLHVRMREKNHMK